MWVKCKDELPPKNSTCRIKFNNREITYGYHFGYGVWVVQGMFDESLYIESWFKKGETNEMG